MAFFVLHKLTIWGNLCTFPARLWACEVGIATQWVLPQLLPRQHRASLKQLWQSVTVHSLTTANHPTLTMHVMTDGDPGLSCVRVLSMATAINKELQSYNHTKFGLWHTFTSHTRRHTSKNVSLPYGPFMRTAVYCYCMLMLRRNVIEGEGRKKVGRHPCVSQDESTRQKWIQWGRMRRMGKLFSKQGTTGRKLEQDNHTNDSCLNGKVR